MEDLPIQKVTISGPTLSSLINRFTSSQGDIEGLLFGQFSLFTPPSLSDDSPSPSPSPSSLIATITSFISTTTSTTSLLSHNHNHRHRLIGWFSGRRRSPLRPSLREFSISHSLSSNPLLSNSPPIFLLLTTPFLDSVIHTHEYKAFLYRPSSTSFDALPLSIVNIGPAFRGQYGAFCPNSHLPYLPCDLRVGSPMREDGKERENVNAMKRVAKDQKDLDCYAEGYQLGNLSRLMGSDAVSYMTGVEDLYEKMLAKLDSLAKLVETSSLKVLEQENHNMKLRHRVTGIQ